VYHKPRLADGSADDNTEDSVVKWRIMTADDFDRWMERLSNRFMQVFLEWQVQNSHIISSSMEDMRKINGLSRAHEERRRSELRKWLFTYVAKDFVQYE
jgi:hypothetical protein